MARQIWKGDEIELWVVSPDEMDLLENNPRYMPKEKFNRLVENIKRDGYLSSVVFCVKKGNKFKVLSGNHRVKAAKVAGLEKIIVMTPNADLPEDRQKAIALSHNALVGEDDPFLLKKMYESIKNVEDKLYSGIDKKTLDKLIEKLQAKKIMTSISFDFKTVVLTFLPEDLEELEKILKSAEMILKDQDIYIGRLKDFEILKRAMSKARVKLNVKERSAVLMALIEYAYEKLKEEENNGQEN